MITEIAQIYIRNLLTNLVYRVRPKKQSFYNSLQPSYWVGTVLEKKEREKKMMNSQLYAQQTYKWFVRLQKKWSRKQADDLIPILCTGFYDDDKEGKKPKKLFALNWIFHCNHLCQDSIPFYFIFNCTTESVFTARQKLEQNVKKNIISRPV